MKLRCASCFTPRWFSRTTSLPTRSRVMLDRSFRGHGRPGECLVLSAVRESEIVKEGQGVRIFPRRIIVVLLGSNSRFAEGGQLIGQGWQLYDQWSASGRLVDPKKML